MSEKHDIILDSRGRGHAFSHDTGGCVVHPRSADCMGYLLMFGYTDTGIRA